MQKVDNNKFLLANVVGFRAKEILEGSIPFIDDYNPLNPIETSMNELSRGKFTVSLLKEPPAKPMKEIEEKAKDFWAIDNLEKKEPKKAKKVIKKK